MSHFTKVATKINSLSALRASLEKAGIPFECDEGRGCTVNGYQGQTIDAALSIKLGKYDIGFCPAEDGTYYMVADWWGVETMTGKTECETVEAINQGYSVARVLESCAEQGYTMTEEVQEDGSVKLVALAGY